LEQLDRFKTLLVEQLADATGKPVTKTDVAVSAGVPVNEEERTNVALKRDVGMRYHATRN
jgi:nitrogen fixation protein FixH